MLDQQQRWQWLDEGEEKKKREKKTFTCFGFSADERIIILNNKIQKCIEC